MKHIDTMLSVFQRHSCICQVIIWTPEGPISYASESLIVIFLPWYNCYVYVLNGNKMFLNWIEIEDMSPSVNTCFLKSIHVHVYLTYLKCSQTVLKCDLLKSYYSRSCLQLPRGNLLVLMQTNMVSKFDLVLTHCGLVLPYNDLDLSQH